jgi:hypothetical protein
MAAAGKLNDRNRLVHLDNHLGGHVRRAVGWPALAFVPPIKGLANLKRFDVCLSCSASGLGSPARQADGSPRLAAAATAAAGRQSARAALSN